MGSGGLGCRRGLAVQANSDGDAQGNYRRLSNASILSGRASLRRWPRRRVGCNEAVAAAEASVQDAPAEFQEAADRGDLEAMGKFLAKRIADQQAGREWI